jgi:hypothetical protein
MKVMHKIQCKHTLKHTQTHTHRHTSKFLQFSMPSITVILLLYNVMSFSSVKVSKPVIFLFFRVCVRE